MKKTIPEIKQWLTQRDRLTEKEIETLQTDSRIGVQRLLASYRRKQQLLHREAMRIQKMWDYEQSAREQGYQMIAGIDEAGRGPLAGPVVAAAVVLPTDFDGTGMDDSKRLTTEQRESLRERIEQQAIIGIGIVDSQRIDQINILRATYEAMRMAVSQIEEKVDMLLIDAVQLPGISIAQQSIIRGDQQSHSIAAASIMAKTTRDRWMKRLADQYPEYGFDQHMGYPTSEHLQAIKQHGPCPIHRFSFAPLKGDDDTNTYGYGSKKRNRSFG